MLQVAMILTVFLSVIGHMGAWLGSDGEGLMNSFSVAEQYELAMQSVTVNGQEYTANVLDDTKWCHMLNGNVCDAESIVITVALIAGKLLQSEKSNLAIYKSLGLHTEKLRVSFALRFFLVVFCGAVLGFAAAGLLSNPVIGTVFKIFGIGEFSAGFSLLGNVAPLVVIPVLLIISAWIYSARLARISIVELIAENGE